MEVTVRDQQDMPLAHDDLADAARAVLAAELADDEVEEAEACLLFVDEARMHELNLAYRGIDKATDVLSFHMGEDDDGPGGLLGDVVICPAVAARYATEAGRATEAELRTLVVHGILHLLGYDDETEPERGRMFARQGELLQSLARREAAVGARGTTTDGPRQDAP
jgi:probable rRNA maturation factor